MKTINLCLTILPLVLCSLFVTGCGQVMAMKQPRPFTPGTLVTGEKRTAIIAELGQPVTSEEHSNVLSDAYKYVDGGKKNNALSKTGRVLIYTAGDVFTCWLDQVIWMPTEAFGFSGTVHAVTVDYTKYEDGYWHAAAIDDKILKGRAARLANANAASQMSGQTTSLVIVPAPIYSPSVTYRPYAYSPPTIHYTGNGIGAIQAGLMNNIGRR